MHQTLKVEFPGELQASRRIGGSDGPEICVTQIGVWYEEVRVVEGVKEFEAELETLRFGDVPPFLQSHVPIDEARGPQVG